MEENQTEEPIENNTNERVLDHRLFFDGEGARFFSIWAVNAILTIITLGLYYPWAKVAMRKYIWNETRLEEDRFVFHGTGKELFRGFIIVYGAIILLTIVMSFFPYGVVLLWLFVILIMPYAIFGAWRYRVSRTSFRGIFFSFKGDMGEFSKLFYINMFLTIITFGIYASWMRVNVMKYLFEHTNLGQYEFGFRGRGDDLFGINILGAILSVITLYIYVPFYVKNRFNFIVNHTIIYHDDNESAMESTLEGSEAFGTMFVNMLILIFTLGIGFPWVMVRHMKMFFNNVQIPGEVDFDCLEQDADDFRDATGDDLLDVLDMGFDI